jgi:hypothetical protein
MNISELLDAAIATAIAGTEVDKNPVLRQRLEADAIAPQALHQLAKDVAGNPELRARLEKTFSVALTNGVGAIPAGLFVEYLREGSVRDGDTGANNGLGNILSRVKYYNDFITDQSTLLGLYCVVVNQIYTRPPGSVMPADTIGPLAINAPFVPTPDDMNTEVPDECVDTLVELLAIRMRGLIPPPEK